MRYLFILLLFPLGLFAQTKPIESALGVKFGASKESVQAIVKARGGTPDLSDSKNPNTLNYKNLKVGGRLTYSVTFQFVNNKVYQILIFFTSEKDPLSIDLYNDIRNDLVSVYGESEETRNFKSPYEKGDGYEITALKGGYATIEDLWLDPVNETGIKLSINDILLIILRYQDGKLFEANRKNNNPLKDF